MNGVPAGCALCGVELGAQRHTREFDDVEQVFCCGGCVNVYTILHESGAIAAGEDFRSSDLYRESLRLGLISRPEPETEPFIPSGAEQRDVVFQLEGMWCSSCGWLIEHALTKTPGVIAAEVIFTSDLLKLRYTPQYLPLEHVLERIKALGYRAIEYTGERTANHSDLILRLGVATFLWLNVMTFSLVVYAGYFEHVAEPFARYIPFVLMGLAAPAVFWCAWPVLRLAAIGARNGTLRMESLLALGILTAFGYSVAQSFIGGQHVYFDTACAIVTLALTGKLIERAARDRALDSITLLYRLMPRKARLLAKGREHFVAVEALDPGTVFVVKDGERVPADGVVAEGRSHADESVLTGESAPRLKAPGDTLVCGSINSGGVLHVRATRPASESTLAQMIHMVEGALASHSHIERQVDRMARAFTPIVMLIAIATLIGWLAAGRGAGDAIMHAIAVLVIACPCALGLATPLALTAAVAKASRRGILVSDTRVLETIRQVDVLVLDKTGTVTNGDFRLLEIVGDTSRMAAIAALETISAHPLARAVVSHTKPVGEVHDVNVHPGQGISGTVDDVRYFAGNRALAPAPAAFAAQVRTWEEAGHTVAYFGWDGVTRGVFAFGDAIKLDAAPLCAELSRRGVKTLLLSGDAEPTTRHVARLIGAGDYVAEALPARKLEVIAELRRQGKVVAMLGDGVNDAPSLATADLGIALSSGADIAMRAAPLVLMSRSLSAVIEVFDLAHRTLRVVRQNLFWAFAYNVIGIALAISGVLNPILAAGAMVFSSISVIANSRRLVK